MARKNLSESEIIARIEDEESKAYGINDSALSRDRSKALDYYNGEVETDAPEGRSNVVSRDVLDVVESALPQVLKVFVSGDDVVCFEPRGMEDEEAAAQETAYVNYLVMEKNNGFATFYTWFKDGMLSKNGYVKVYFEEKEDTEKESYTGLTDTQLTMLLQDETVEVLEHSQYPDEQDAQQRYEAMQQIAQAAQMGDQNAHQQLIQLQSQPPAMLHDVKVQIVNKHGCIEIKNVAPEDIMVSTDCRSVSVQEARFVQHRSYMSREDMEEMGWNVPENLSFTDDQGWQESNSRDLYDEDDAESEDILVRDTYYHVNGELMRYVVVGNTIIHKEECEIIPFAVLTPHIQPHRHVGMSYADLCVDIQDIKTSLIRSQLDNQYLSNNGRVAISDKVNLEDMLVSRPGGVVRVNGIPGQEIQQLQHIPFPATSFTMVEYFDSVKEKRTGITAYNQGLDADSLNKTASGISQIMSAAQQRLETVARTFAETGVKELFMLVHRLVRQNFTKPEIVRLRGKWVEVDPRQWKTRTDMSITVGLGTGNKDQQLVHLQTILAAQQQAMQIGLATPKNIYNALSKLTINAGFKNPEEFWTDPEQSQPQPQQPAPEVQVAQMKIQADQAKSQVELQADVQRFQAESQMQREIEQLKADAKLQEIRGNLELQAANDARDAEREQMNALMQAELEKQRLEFDRWKALLDAEVSIVTAQMSSQPTEGTDKVADTSSSELLQAIVQKITSPKMVIRDESGRVVGMQ